MITITNVTKQFGINPVLRGVDLHVAHGEFVTLVGANGAGKSTLLKIVATLAQPTSGKVEIGGYPLNTHAHKVRRHIGLVSHQSLLYADLTAAENLDYFGRLYNIPKREEGVEAALKKVGLWARKRDVVRTFSRGMMQRLSIARATLHAPDVLLFDEPYTGLDQNASALLDDLLRREKETGRTILLITHDLLRGLNLCDRAVILHKGKIARDVAHGEMGEQAFVALYQNVMKGGGNNQ